MQNSITLVYNSDRRVLPIDSKTIPTLLLIQKIKCLFANSILCSPLKKVVALYHDATNTVISLTTPTIVFKDISNEFHVLVAEVFDPSVLGRHVGVKCTGCGTHPLMGVRFKCVQDESVNFCHGCFVQKVGNYLKKYPEHYFQEIIFPQLPRMVKTREEPKRPDAKMPSQPFTAIPQTTIPKPQATVPKPQTPTSPFDSLDIFTQPQVKKVEKTENLLNAGNILDAPFIQPVVQQPVQKPVQKTAPVPIQTKSDLDIFAFQPSISPSDSLDFLDEKKETKSQDVFSGLMGFQQPMERKESTQIRIVKDIEVPTRQRSGSVLVQNVSHIKTSHIVRSVNTLSQILLLQSHPAENQNTVVSPLSLGLSFGMLLNLTSDTGKLQLVRKLFELKFGENVDGVLAKRINHLLKKQILGVTKKSLSPVQFYNAIFMDKTLAQHFIGLQGLMKNYYGAEMHELDSDNAMAARQINNWIFQTTNRLLTSSIDSTSLDLMTRPLIFVNIICLKGYWAKKFDPRKTFYDKFYLTETSSKRGFKSMYFMTQKSNFKYYETKQFQAVELPLGDLSKPQLVVTLVLPAKGVTTDDLIQSHNMESSDFAEKFVEREGTVTIPKFKIQFDTEVSSLVAKLCGVSSVRDLVDHQIPTGTYKLIHKTYLELNEDGAKVSSLTSGGTDAFLESEDVFEMRVDRPFVVVIKDAPGCVVFHGQVKNPIIL